MQKYGYFTTLAKKSKTFLEINENIWAPKKLGDNSYLSNFFHTFVTKKSMTMKRVSLRLILTLSVFLFTACCYRINEGRASTASETGSRKGYVTQHDAQLWLNGDEYHFVGANLWYGAILGSKERRTGRNAATSMRKDHRLHQPPRGTLPTNRQATRD